MFVDITNCGTESLHHESNRHIQFCNILIIILTEKGDVREFNIYRPSKGPSFFATNKR